jgi:antitoxin VapB
MAKGVRAKVFWSGGSQAVRLPKALRLESSEVEIRREGDTLILAPAPEGDDWVDFWERLLPLREPVRRWSVKRTDKRGPL